MISSLKVLLIFLLLSPVCTAQPNLVPNGDFENYSSCPNSLGQIYKAEPWFQPYTPQWSSEYYNACGSGHAGVPDNDLGSQLAKSGFGYAGIDTYSNGFDFREYIEVELTDTLVQNVNYCVEFYVSVSENWSVGVDGIGAYFSSDSLIYGSPPYGVLNLVPQVQNPSGNVISDTLTWTLIKGEFVANGGERFITIGNFKTDAMTDTIHQGNAIFSHFYIDDVSVVQGSCNVGVNEFSPESIVSVFPNPTTSKLYIKSPLQSEIISFKLFDLTGKEILETKDKVLDMSELSPGLYFYQIQMKGENIFTGKVIKE
ncbi:MAG: T9SS type A sorting domain-containing protein [Bacteroidota bacterium]